VGGTSDFTYTFLLFYEKYLEHNENGLILARNVNIMDAKITLSFDAQIIDEAKSLAETLGISLSRFTELIYSKAVAQGPKSIEDLPISNWVLQVAEEQAVYVAEKKRNRKALSDAFFESRK
jgi:hypothetical protein